MPEITCVICGKVIMANKKTKKMCSSECVLKKLRQDYQRKLKIKK